MWRQTVARSILRGFCYNQKGQRFSRYTKRGKRFLQPKLENLGHAPKYIFFVEEKGAFAANTVQWRDHTYRKNYRDVFRTRMLHSGAGSQNLELIWTEHMRLLPFLVIGILRTLNLIYSSKLKIQRKNDIFIV